MGVLGVINSMLLTRILEPAEMGLYGMLISFASTAIMFISFGYDASYTRFYYNHGYSHKKFMFLSLRVPLVIFCLFALVMLEPTFSLTKLFFGKNITWLTVLIILLYVFSDVLHKFTQLTARMEEHAINYIVSNIIAKSGFLIIVFAVFMIMDRVSFNWITLSFAISCFAAVLMNVYVFFKVANKKVESDRPVSPKEMLIYGFPNMINNVLVLIIPLIEKLIIKNLAGEDTLGIFTSAAIFQTVVLLLTNTLINIWNPLVFKHCDNEKAFKPILHDFGYAATMVSVAGLALCILLRRFLVLIMGADYHQVYVIAPAIMFGALFHILNIIYSVGINIKKKTYHLIISPIIQAAISFALCFLLIPKLGLAGIAIASLASLVISKTYRIFVGIHYYGTGKTEIKPIILCVLATAASVISIFLSSEGGFIYDVILSLALIGVSAVIVNRDIFSLMKSMLSIIRPSKEEKE